MTYKGSKCFNLFCHIGDIDIKENCMRLYIAGDIFFFRRKTILRAEERQGYSLHDNLYCDTHVECKTESFGVHKKLGFYWSILHRFLRNFTKW